MKTQSWLLATVRVLLTIFWYFNIVLAVFAFCVLTWKISTSDYTEFSNPVKYPLNPNTIQLKSLSPTVDNIVLQPDQAIIKMHLKNTFMRVVAAYFFFFAFEALVMSIIYQLRKFFDTVHQHTPFVYDNIRRLKITAICFASLTVLNILLGISSAIILKSNVKDMNLMNMVWHDSLIGFILGAVIYIIADVFKQGFNLQKENEEFV
jgi:uncharacterized membrane protein YedE/YeeE